MAAIRNSLKIAMIPADGIGKEVLPAAESVLLALGSSIPKPEFIPLLAGWEVFQRTGTALPQETVQILKDKARVDGAIFGSVSSPSRKVTGYSSPIVQLRKDLGLYANIRPVASVPGFPGKPINMVIVRENTECLYIKSEKEFPADGTDPRGKYVIASRQISSAASTRIGKMAFEVARTRGIERAARPDASFWKGPPKVTIVHKSNVLSLSDGLFRESVRAVKDSDSEGRYGDVVMEEQLVDSMVYKMFREPEAFDVAVAPNLYGDILSDGAAALVGSLGLVPSLNAGDDFAMGEPVHGSAPDIEGKFLANPIATIRSTALLLSHLGYTEQAARIYAAVDEVLLEGRILTRDIQNKDGVWGTAKTDEVTAEIVRKIQG